jgi:hypothetical protein
MPNIGTSPGTHSLDALLYFLLNSHQVVYVELSIKTIHIFFLLSIESQALSTLPIPVNIAATITDTSTVSEDFFAVMSLPPHREDPHYLFNFLDGLQDNVDFGNAFGFLDPDFGAYFTFRDAFDFDSISSGSFKYDNVSCEFSVERRQCRGQKKHRKNCIFQLKNVKKSCWYQYFMRSGLTQEIMHKLSNSNRFGEI